MALINKINQTKCCFMTFNHNSGKANAVGWQQDNFPVMAAIKSMGN